MNSKKGISLIVLVITIIVIIILAAAVILSLNNNNVLTNSRRAVNENDFSETQSAWAIALGEVVVKQLDSVVLSGEITSSGFNAKGYAGETPAAASTDSTPSTISTSAQAIAKAIDIEKLGLPSTFTNVAICDNKVVALVKNGQLMKKQADGTLKITNANFTGTILASADDKAIIESGVSYTKGVKVQ